MHAVPRGWGGARRFLREGNRKAKKKRGKYRKMLGALFNLYLCPLSVDQKMPSIEELPSTSALPHNRRTRGCVSGQLQAFKFSSRTPAGSASFSLKFKPHSVHLYPSFSYKNKTTLAKPIHWGTRSPANPYIDQKTVARQPTFDAHRLLIRGALRRTSQRRVLNSRAASFCKHIQTLEQPHLSSSPRT